jgi:sulfite exporter TauE/SafE
MNADMTLLAVTAASIGFFHTLLGPDHYIPFVAMSRARRWSLPKTMIVTTLCGLAHVLSSVVLGLIGIALGLAVSRLEAFESFRGDLAAWALTAFGFAYLVWGVHRAIRNRPHTHPHVHADGTLHVHEHGHHSEHAHVHESHGRDSITPWVLFTVFVFGPCEPLIPILMYPAAHSSGMGMLFITAIFALTTIATMLTVVVISCAGLSRLSFGRMERYSHALAGFAITACGFGVLFLGL